MRCIVCDRCKAVIENPRRCRVITCARPWNPRALCGNGKESYRGNDPQQNDFLWEKELCDDCLDELEAFFEAGGLEVPNSDIPESPENPGGSEEAPPAAGDGGGDMGG